MRFRDAVRTARPPVDRAFRAGKQALQRRHRDRVTCTESRRLTGSIALDDALEREPEHADQPRWDYGLGYRPASGPERVVWVEVHKATTHEVDAVLRKLRWLKAWLSSEGGQLQRMTDNAADGDERFVWLASAGVKIRSGTPQMLRLNASGIGRVRRHLSLP